MLIKANNYYTQIKKKKNNGINRLKQWATDVEFIAVKTTPTVHNSKNT